MKLRYSWVFNNNLWISREYFILLIDSLLLILIVKRDLVAKFIAAIIQVKGLVSL